MTNPGDVLTGDCAVLFATWDQPLVDLLITDPPYANSKHDWDQPVDWEKWWALARQVLKPDGAAVIFGQGAHSIRVAAANLRGYRYSLIWEANTTTSAMNANRRPLPVHQDMLVFYAKPPVYHPQMWEGAPSHRANRKGKTNHQRRFYGEMDWDNQEPGLTSRYPRSVIRFDRVHVRQSLIPSQKPVELLRWLIRTYSDPGQTVLDPFAGVLSTALAADLEGRRAISIEADPERIALGMSRFDD